MKEILVAGIGNRIMMDDGIGIYLVEDLQQLFTNPKVEFAIGETDVDFCLSKISEYNRVIIIDAFLSGKKSGKVTVTPLKSLEKGSPVNYSLHGMHVLNSLQYYKKDLKGIFIGIEPFEINYGFYLSDVLLSRYSRIMKSVMKHMNRYIERCGGDKNA